MTDTPIPTGSDSIRSRDHEFFVDAFARGLQVIRSFSETSQRQTLSDVARASARRLLHTLLRLRYVDYDGKYFSLKPKILDLGYAYISSLELSGLAENPMQELATTMNASCSLSVLDGNEVVYIRRAEVRPVTTCSSTVGHRVPAHLLAMGRVQLAALDDEALRQYLSTVALTRHTPYTVTDPGELERIIRADGKRGYSIVRRELDEGLCSIAMPIRDRDGETVAALGLGLRPDLSNDPATLERACRELTGTVDAIGELLRMRG